MDRFIILSSSNGSIRNPQIVSLGTRLLFGQVVEDRKYSLAVPQAEIWDENHNNTVNVILLCLMTVNHHT